MEKVNNFKKLAEYESYLKQHIKSYCVTEFKGFGKYNKMYFKEFDNAKKSYDAIMFYRPTARVLVYGLSKPPHTKQTVSVPVYWGEDK